jgi:hypothetical protein
MHGSLKAVGKPPYMLNSTVHAQLMLMLNRTCSTQLFLLLIQWSSYDSVCWYPFMTAIVYSYSHVCWDYVESIKPTGFILSIVWLPTIGNNCYFDDEWQHTDFREEYLAKIEKRIKTYTFKTLNEPRPDKKLLVLDVDYTLFGMFYFQVHNFLWRIRCVLSFFKFLVNVCLDGDLLIVTCLMKYTWPRYDLGIFQRFACSSSRWTLSWSFSWLNDREIFGVCKIVLPRKSSIAWVCF